MNLSIIKRKRWRKGNVTTLWAFGLPIFMFIFMFLSTIMLVWLHHAKAMVAADAASLAATKKLDGLVNQEIDNRMTTIIANNSRLPENQRISDPYYAVIGTKHKKKNLVKYVINYNQDAIKKEVRKYATANGTEDSGKIIFFQDGRIRVEAKVKFNPPIFKDSLKGKYIKGTGDGPTRDYMKWLTRPNQKVLEY
ncbi:hypothetical protein IC620_08635 [Hazenella sp. IB182357]|uniref:Putative Flp pilus-assembly TadG-like N-terminal domain-containing protein n=1 Tax=Polycladospora coralii TaxID=2771432 RepID=A0A926NFL4_9BACL|nr:pilus assembly protein TadG-related protein [Polycladospora coralii]MBD1372423.1 hypothetical protein [Polycladospora coralii]